MSGDVELLVWRHPRPIDAAGRCIGRTDLRVDPRRARRLADRIAATARREHLPREIWTSPLARCADVGHWLARRHRFVHRIDPRLAELDFGAWDGLPWSAISPAEVTSTPGRSSSTRVPVITRTCLRRRATAAWMRTLSSGSGARNDSAASRPCPAPKSICTRMRLRGGCGTARRIPRAGPAR